MIWSVPRLWDGGDVWIIGGGPSIITQFNIPDDVVQSVLSGKSSLSVYSPYMEAIHDKHIIGINVAYMLGDWVDMVFFGDGGFFQVHKARLAQFPGVKITCHGGATGDKWVKYLGRDGKKPRGISTSSNLVSWNGNSGGAAMSVAVHAGAKRIILVGFDMKLSEARRQHFHDVYNRGVIEGDKRVRKLPFDRHLRGFPVIAEDTKRMGVEVINASPDSAITCFPKCSVKDLL